MSEIKPLTVTLELPETEFKEENGNLFARCPQDGTWVPLADYYSEVSGSLLPLVGNVDYSNGDVKWKETVRIFHSGADKQQAPGGVLRFNASDGINTRSHFGG